MLTRMNAIKTLIETIGDSELETALSEIIQRGGIMHLGTDISYIGLPIVHEMTALPDNILKLKDKGLVVICIAGDMSYLPEHMPHFLSLGYTHVVWRRGYKGGTKRWRAETIENYTNRFKALHDGRRNNNSSEE